MATVLICPSALLSLAAIHYTLLHVHHSELMVSLFIRCTMRCEIWAHPAGRVLCLEYRVSWFRVPPEAVFFTAFFHCLGCAVLLCLVCLFDLASFFLPSHLSFKNMYISPHFLSPPPLPHAARQPAGAQGRGSTGREEHAPQTD